MKVHHFARKRRQLKKLASEYQQSRGIPKQKKDNLLNKIKALVSYLKRTMTRRDLRRALGAMALMFGLSSTGNLRAQSFAPPQINPFGISNIQNIALPAFADLDNDGDMDMILGDYNDSGAILSYFENIGNESNPNFAAPITNPFNLSGNEYYLIPVLADLDNDGDIEIGMFEYEAALVVQENIGTLDSPNFGEAMVNPFGIDIGTIVEAVLPTLGDIDSDGDVDILFATIDGDLNVMTNNGSAAAPSFGAYITNPYGLVGTSDFLSPRFVDLDADGDLDLMVGTYGSMGFFENGVVGISENDLDQMISIYPNPTSHQLQIKTELNISAITVFDTMGKKCDLMATKENTIDFSTAATGIYHVQLVLEDGTTYSKKITKP